MLSSAHPSGTGPSDTVHLTPTGISLGGELTSVAPTGTVNSNWASYVSTSQSTVNGNVVLAPATAPSITFVTTNCPVCRVLVTVASTVPPAGTSTEDGLIETRS